MYRFDRDTLNGYVNLASWLQGRGVELLSQEGNLLTAPYEDVKVVCFVKDWDEDDPSAQRKLFTYRPKSAGLWVRFRFRDGDVMDGLLANDLLQLDPYGYSVVPPDPAGNRQRLYVPRAALLNIQVVAVVGSPTFSRKRTKQVPEAQIRLFE